MIDEQREDARPRARATRAAPRGPRAGAGRQRRIVTARSARSARLTVALPVVIPGMNSTRTNRSTKTTGSAQPASRSSADGARNRPACASTGLPIDPSDKEPSSYSGGLPVPVPRRAGSPRRRARARARSPRRAGSRRRSRSRSRCRPRRGSSRPRRAPTNELPARLANASTRPVDERRDAEREADDPRVGGELHPEFCTPHGFAFDG